MDKLCSLPTSKVFSWTILKNSLIAECSLKFIIWYLFSTGRYQDCILTPTLIILYLKIGFRFEILLDCEISWSNDNDLINSVCDISNKVFILKSISFFDKYQNLLFFLFFLDLKFSLSLILIAWLGDALICRMKNVLLVVLSHNN